MKVAWYWVVLLVVITWWLAVQHEQDLVTKYAAQQYKDAHPYKPPTGGLTG